MGQPVVQLGADELQGRDADNSDERGDEAIFNGGRAGLILGESGEKRRHGLLRLINGFDDVQEFGDDGSKL
jgi:hypothetical protein